MKEEIKLLKDHNLALSVLYMDKADYIISKQTEWKTHPKYGPLY